MYSYEEVLVASVEYFGGDELAAKVFVDKYALRNNENELLEKTPADMHHRLAKEFARVEKDKYEGTELKPLTESEIFSLFDRFERIVPQGSPMYGIGNPYQYVAIGNCFVLPSPLDSYAGILYTDAQITQVTSRRGGVGWCISKLRPNEMPVKNAAKTTSGAISFMKRFSNTIREIGIHGRRGASLQSIHIQHPDIDKFISVKQDLKDVTGSNISVQISDEFMRAVEKDLDFELKWPVCEEHAKEMGRPYPSISKTVKAREVWKQFIHSAWSMAEPGCMFFDTVMKNSNSRSYGYSEVSSNPCQSEHSLVLTPDGIRRFKDIDIGSKIWSNEGWTTVIKKWSTGINEVYEYKTTAGRFLGTDKHQVICKGEKIEAKDAECLDILSGLYETNIVLDPQIIMDGLVLGDGTQHCDMIHLLIGDDDQDYFKSEISHLIKSNAPGYAADNKAWKISTSITLDELQYTYLRQVPDRYKFGDKNTVCSFLRGLYSANGSICGGRITLKASSFDIIKDTQVMLSSIGIRSYYTTNKPSMVKFNNGEYLCKQSYDLNITADKNKFVALIGFIQIYKNSKIVLPTQYKQPKISYDIQGVDFLGEMETFDITVDNKSHTYWTDCVNVSNCGEQYLPAYCSCRLILQNLLGYVDNPYTKESAFNWVKFKEDARLMQRLADDMVDLEIEHIDRILKKIYSDPEPMEVKVIAIDTWNKVKAMAIQDRRTGCGNTALADCLAAMDIKYGSKTSIEFAEKMQQELKFATYDSSIDMAKAINSFPEFDIKKDLQSEFIQRLKEENPTLFEKMKRYGRRNMVLLTISPAGTVSCETKTSSGIEPVFMLQYTRRKKGNPGDIGFKSDFVDANGDNWMHFDVYHHGLSQWLKANPGKNIEDSPYWGCTANEIEWKHRIKLQSVLQKHIDNSISSTINLPEDTTEETVDKIYIEAWKAGCKGMTIYRDKCRDGVLISTKSAEPNKRPKELICDVQHSVVAGKDYFILVGLLNGKPYEVFAGKNGFIGKKVKTGRIIQKRKGYYKAIFDDENETELSPITNSCSENEETITRLTSALLRSNANLSLIMDQLDKVQGGMHSFAKAIARAIKKYIPDGTKIEGERCPECGEGLIREEGCAKCIVCSWSKCN